MIMNYSPQQHYKIDKTSSTMMLNSFKLHSMETKLKCMSYARFHGIQRTAQKYEMPERLLYRWKVRMEAIEDPEKKSVNKENKLQTRWMLVEHQLVMYVLEKQRLGTMMSYKNVQEVACKIAGEHGMSGFKCSRSWVSRFFRRNNLSARNFSNTEGVKISHLAYQLFDFREFVRKSKYGLEQCNVCNLYEVPISFNLMVENEENIDDSSDEKEKRLFSVLLSVMENGEKLPPYVIFKGKYIPKGNYPDNVIMRTNKLGWVTSDLISDWIVNVWKKRPEYNPDPRMSLIIVDSPPKNNNPYSLEDMRNCSQVAVMPSTLNKMIQPLYVTRLFEKKLKEYSEQWMIETEGRFKNGTRRSYEASSRLISDCFYAINEKDIREGFIKGFTQDYDDIMTMLADELKDFH